MDCADTADPIDEPAEPGTAPIPRPLLATPTDVSDHELTAEAMMSWTVEALQTDRGTGLRSWFIVRHADRVWYCADRGELAALLDQHRVEPGDIAVPDDGLPPGETGCE